MQFSKSPNRYLISSCTTLHNGLGYGDKKIRNVLKLTETEPKSTEVVQKSTKVYEKRQKFAIMGKNRWKSTDIIRQKLTIID